ncbi:MAG: DNA internalization-related competence protein ComEC/Rec2 [Pseudomonadales bacterium]
MHANPRAAHVVRGHIRGQIRGQTAAPFQILLGLIAGVLSLAFPWAYPLTRALPWLAGAALLVGLGCILLQRLGGGRVLLKAPVAALAAFLLGHVWGSWQIGSVLAAQLPNCADERTRSFELDILGDPQLEPASTAGGEDAVSVSRVARFNAEVRVPADPACPGLHRHVVRLAWYDPPDDLARAQHWRVQGRLKPPWGYRNGAGFDYERWLLGEGLGGTGYVKTGVRTAPTPSPRALLPELREWVRGAIEARHLEHGPFILALMVGDDSRISARHWQLLRDSGTVHLLVVSGLHVGMIAGILFQLGRALARLSPLLLVQIGSRRVASVLAVAGSGAYVWLAGMGVPALRAWLMSTAVLVGMSAGRSVSPRRILALALAAIVIANPLVVHQQGFWLSFAAVISLVVYFEPRIDGRQRNGVGRLLNPLRQLLAVQLVLLVALSPLLAMDQAAVPAGAPLVNAIAVPTVTLVVLPAILLSAPLLFLCPELADWLLGWTDQVLGWLLDGAALGAGIDALPMGVAGFGEWLVLAGTVLLLGGAPRRVAAVMLIALWWVVLRPDADTPSPGELRVTALDVGQGSAIVLQTRHHRLLYDTGARYPSGFDLGEAVVVPFLRRSRRPGLDAMVLSHDDVDHTGGAASVHRLLAPARLWTSFPLPDDHWGRNLRQPCRQGIQWLWDGVRFEFLHPPANFPGSDNDGSCVLRVEAAGGRVLIAGDVSARVERRLPKSPVDLAFAPHHGSATSSSAAFVRGFAPRIVFISTDRRSRYGHPHPDVLARYEAVRVHVTGREGALRWESSRPDRVVRERSRFGAYWHRTWSDAVVRP